MKLKNKIKIFEGEYKNLNTQYVYYHLNILAYIFTVIHTSPGFCVFYVFLIQKSWLFISFIARMYPAKDLLLHFFSCSCKFFAQFVQDYFKNLKRPINLSLSCSSEKWCVLAIPVSQSVTQATFFCAILICKLDFKFNIFYSAQLVALTIIVDNEVSNSILRKEDQIISDN